MKFWSSTHLLWFVGSSVLQGRLNTIMAIKTVFIYLFVCLFVPSIIVIAHLFVEVICILFFHYHKHTTPKFEFQRIVVTLFHAAVHMCFIDRITLFLF